MLCCGSCCACQNLTEVVVPLLRLHSPKLLVGSDENKEQAKPYRIYSEQSKLLHLISTEQQKKNLLVTHIQPVAQLR